MNPWAKQKQFGFTIVELLIVIVVIAILAVIAIVAYRGIQDRAYASRAQAAANSVTKLLGVFQAINGIYPADLSTINNGGPMPTTDGSTYAYHPGSGNASYCVTVTNGKSSYKVTDTATAPVSGGCPGDGVGGEVAITNLIVNPSAESGSVSPNIGYSGGPMSIDITTAISGTNSILVTTNSAVSPQGMMWKAPTITPSATYVCSVSIKGTSGTAVYVAGRAHDSAGGYIAENYGSKTVTLSSSWQRVATGVFTLPSNAGSLYIQYRVVTPATGIQIWGDAAMCTQGSSTYAYADGDSPNWIWNGATNASTSTGPAL